MIYGEVLYTASVYNALSGAKKQRRCRCTADEMVRYHCSHTLGWTLVAAAVQDLLLVGRLGGKLRWGGGHAVGLPAVWLSAARANAEPGWVGRLGWVAGWCWVGQGLGLTGGGALLQLAPGDAMVSRWVCRCLSFSPLYSPCGFISGAGVFITAEVHALDVDYDVCSFARKQST